MATANHDFIQTRSVLPSRPEAAQRRLLRFTTAGSVDDGKSTLIGRLLYDSQAVFEDQLASVRNSRINRASGPIDFSLLTDGLRAEREQGITIDVAYRYFSTPKRKFIIADTPGHEQYTRNMVTGASTADAAIVLVDATKGLLPQSRRHAYISMLLGIRCVIAAVNKMDLVRYSEETFRAIERDIEVLGEQLGLETLYVLPISALEGDNVVRNSPRMPWFSGPALLRYLEELEIGQQQEGRLRFPVQYVIRPDATFRGFAGQIESGSVSVGDTVRVLPSGALATVKSLESFDGAKQTASTGDAITITLTQEIDISRGDLLSDEIDAPAVSQKFEADLVWMSEHALDTKKHYVLKHTTRTVRARVSHIDHRVDIDTLRHVPSSTLQLNDIGVVQLSTTAPIFFDPYFRNRTMGSFILIDPITNATVAAGMIKAAVGFRQETASGRVTVAERAQRHGHPPALLLIRGNSQAADAVERALFEDGWHVYLMNGGDYDSGQLETVLGILQTTGAVVVLFGKVVITASVRSLFDENVFTFDATADVAKEVVLRMTRWRSASERTEGAGDEQ